jgi:hypothetical protein
MSPRVDARGAGHRIEVARHALSAAQTPENGRFSMIRADRSGAAPIAAP